jgi:hypothetical protein
MEKLLEKVFILMSKGIEIITWEFIGDLRHRHRLHVHHRRRH